MQKNTSVSWYDVTYDGNSRRITIPKKTNKLVLFSILRHNLSKSVTQTGLYCSKQLETNFNQFGKKSLHITFNRHTRHLLLMDGLPLHVTGDTVN